MVLSVTQTILIAWHTRVLIPIQSAVPASREAHPLNPLVNAVLVLRHVVDVLRRVNSAQIQPELLLGYWENTSLASTRCNRKQESRLSSVVSVQNVE